MEDYQTIFRQIQDTTHDAKRIKTLTTSKPPLTKLRQIIDNLLRAKMPHPQSTPEETPASPRTQDGREMPRPPPDADIVWPHRNPTTPESSQQDEARSPGEGTSLSIPRQRRSNSPSRLLECITESRHRSQPRDENDLGQSSHPPVPKYPWL